MLDTLRRNVRRLSWTLWLVIAAFIVLYIPALVDGGPGNVVAEVDGDPIMATEFQRVYNEQINYYRGLNQGQLPDDFAQNLQIRNVVLEQLIRRKLVLVAAEEQGFAIAPQEIKDRIMEYPVFRDDEGHWVGDQEYLATLQRNGLDPGTFEESIVEDLLYERLTGLITEGVTVSDQELQDLFQRNNEAVSFDFIQIRPTAFEIEVVEEITDSDLQAHYDGDPAAYRLPEQRQVSYALIDTEALRDAVVLEEETLRAEYDANVDDYTIQEQIKARQILFRVPPAATEEERAEIRATADVAAAELLAGADFAELARERSDDPSASTGGDLGWVTRGRQVEGFDDAAFGLEVDATSEVVETAFGFHIIRVDERRDEQLQPFEEVRGQLEQRLAWDAAEDQALDMSEAIRREVLRGTSLEDIVAANELALSTSQLFSQAAGFDEFTSIDFTNRAFALGEGRVGEPVRVRRGYLVYRVDEIASPRTPSLDESRERVRVDVVKLRSKERAAQVAAEYATRLSAGEELEAIAAEASTVTDTATAVTRDGVVPALGRSPQLTQAAFELDSGDAGGPVELTDRFVIFRVTEHTQPDWSLFAEQNETLRQQEIGNRRNRLFEGFVESLRQRYSVRIYDDVLERVAG